MHLASIVVLKAAGAFWKGNIDLSNDNSDAWRLKMQRNLLVLAGLALGALFLAVQSWAQCPEDPNDNGICDTLYVEIWPEDQSIWAFPHYARFPIRVTNDIPDPEVDSIAGIVVPLSFVSSNYSADVRIEAARNTADLYPFPDLDNSIFRHLPSMADPQERNFMMDYAEQMIGLEWDTRILDIGTEDHFWLSTVPTGTPDRRFPGGSRVLTATMTFTIEDDTTTICMDTCFWPPTGRLAFSRMDAVTYFPRHFLPVCQTFCIGTPPYFLDWPSDQHHNTNGPSSELHFEAAGYGVFELVSVAIEFVGDGVGNASFSWVSGLGTPHVEGGVEYDVIDHCQAGGYIRIGVQDRCERWGYRSFNVELSNDPPVLTSPDTWSALAGHTMRLEVSASDPDEHTAAIELEGFWYEPDSLQQPINPPSFDGGNPRLFSWAPTEAETGTWIASFSATDPCGEVDSHQLSIEVGLLYCGDCNADGEINLADVVFLVADLFKDGPSPDPVCRGDGNCSGVRDVGDVVLLINYLFKYGQAPCFECCP